MKEEGLGQCEQHEKRDHGVPAIARAWSIVRAEAGDSRWLGILVLSASYVVVHGPWYNVSRVGIKTGDSSVPPLGHGALRGLLQAVELKNNVTVGQPPPRAT